MGRTICGSVGINGEPRASMCSVEADGVSVRGQAPSLHRVTQTPFAFKQQPLFFAWGRKLVKWIAHWHRRVLGYTGHLASVFSLPQVSSFLL